MEFFHTLERNFRGLEPLTYLCISNDPAPNAHPNSVLAGAGISTCSFCHANRGNKSSVQPVLDSQAGYLYLGSLQTYCVLAGSLVIVYHLTAANNRHYYSKWPRPLDRRGLASGLASVPL